MSILKKAIATVLALSMAVTLSTAAFAEEAEEPAAQNGERVITSDTYNMYYYNLENYLTGALYFLDGQYDIPYISIEEIPDLLYYGSDLFGAQTEFTLEADNGLYEITAWNGYNAIIDCDANEILFSDYNMFFAAPSDGELLINMVPTWVGEDGNFRYLAPSTFSYNRYGKEISIQLDGYGIQLIRQDDLCLMPLQTFVDVFLTNYMIAMLFNGEAVYICIGSDGLSEELAEAYYSVEPSERSEALAEYNYCEMCLMLDMFYGLKEIHNIDYFGSLFNETGLDYYLLSTDPLEYTGAMEDLVDGFFGDLHSALVAPSWYAGEDADPDHSINSITISQDSLNGELYNEFRDKYYPDGVPFYEEIGNTAYITFDHFTEKYIDYYGNGLPEDPSEWDTRGIIIYADQMIKREGSPVENIVLDLSVNGGGAVTAAAYVTAWFLGEFNINVEDTFTGAQVTARYYADINLDGEFDDADAAWDYNLFCLTSPYSFSCGNLVPYSFKSDGTVTLLGKHTGGGACTVKPVSTADGTLFQISGQKRLSTVTNGSFYDVDLGVDPDFHIAKLDNFYNREALTDFINNLY